MPRVPFGSLPQDARVWVFPASRPLSPSEEEDLFSRVDGFLDEWAAHGAPLRGGRDWREGRFLLIAVDEASVPPSGCSIDSMARVLKELGAEWGMSFLDHSPVWFRAGGEVKRVSRPEFKKLVEDGHVGLETPVFDNAIVRLAQVENGEWEKEARVSWHRQAFFPKRK